MGCGSRSIIYNEATGRMMRLGLLQIPLKAMLIPYLSSTEEYTLGTVCLWTLETIA